MKKALIVLAIFLGLTVQAQANPNASPMAATAQQKYVQMDKDANNEVTLEEFKALYPTMKDNVFGIIDINGDKIIDMKEWIAFQEQHMAGMKQENSKEKPHQMSSGDGGRGIDQGQPPVETHPGGTMLISPPSK